MIYVRSAIIAEQWRKEREDVDLVPVPGGVSP